MLQLNPIVTSIFSVLIIMSLLLNFVMIGSRWVKDYITAFTVECWIIGILSLGVGYFAHIDDLYIVGALTILFRGVIFPILLMRMIRKLNIQRELLSTIPVSMSLMICIVLVIFSYIVSTHLSHDLQLHSTILVLALMTMFSIKLIGFALLSIRDQAISKILALLVIENGIFLGSLFLVPDMPIFIELVILFDLLVVIASFGALVNYLHAQVGSTSTAKLNQLVG